MNLEELEAEETRLEFKIKKTKHNQKILRYRHLQALTGHNFYDKKYLSFKYRNGVEAVGLMCYWGIHRTDVSQHNYKKGTFYFVMNEEFPSRYQAFGVWSVDNPVDYTTVKPITKEAYFSFIEETKAAGGQFKRFKT